MHQAGHLVTGTVTDANGAFAFANLPFGTYEVVLEMIGCRRESHADLQVTAPPTPVTMPWINKANTVLHAWYGGNETGNGIADVLYGNTNPSAKLPLTIPKRVNDNPAFLNYYSEAGRTLYGEDVYVGYRWYDKVEIDPLFAFGHGLSYTTFELKDLHLAKADSQATVNVTVSNTGSRAGAEVVQVYVVPPPSSQTTSKTRRPIKELKGF
ncbi:MAG: hypothetical protein EOO62_08625, partial [Hymenobacter sp.]